MFDTSIYTIGLPGTFSGGTPTMLHNKNASKSLYPSCYTQETAKAIR